MGHQSEAYILKVYTWTIYSLGYISDFSFLRDRLQIDFYF